MNTKQLQYAVELAKTRSFSKAAEKLNISQPALSKQILLLEKDLGVKLFERSYVPLRLTSAGEHFVQEGAELLLKEARLKRSMESFATGDLGRLSIGISPFRSLYLIPSIIKKVRQRFPGVQIRLCDTNSEHIRKELTEGKLDFAIVNLPVDDTVLDYIPLEPDVLVLAVPNEMLDKIPNPPKEYLAEMDFKDCRELSFVAVEPAKEMRELFNRLCAAADFRPHIAMEVVGIATAWAMAQSGIGATLVPLQFLGQEAFENTNTTLFKIKNNAYHRQPVIVTRRGQYLSEYAKYAIALLTEETRATKIHN